MKMVCIMQKLSNIKETYLREEPRRETVPQSELVEKIHGFANKKAEIIKAWTELEDHPEAEDMSSEVGSAFDKDDLDEEMRAVYDAIGEGGMVYASFEHSFWIRHKGQLIRVI